MVKEKFIKKSFAIGIIFLFIGSAIIPSIFANVSYDNDLVEITSETYGLYNRKHTVQLTKEEAEEVEQLIADIERRLNEIETREEAVEIFNDAIVELDKYGLLGGLSIKQAQRLVTGGYQNPAINRVLNKISDRNSLLLDDDENIFCIIFGKTSALIGLERVVSGILVKLGSLFYSLNLERLGSYLLLFWIISSIGVYENPIQIFNKVGLGFHDGGDYRIPAEGLIWSLGMNGKKSWNNSFYGNLPVLPIPILVGGQYYPGIIGYTGLILHSSDYAEFYLLGSALWLKINTEPSW